MSSPHLKLTSEVKYLKGVGPARAELLDARGIRTVEDLLYYTPFRYEDRTRLTAVGDLVPGQTATILVKVLTCGLTRTRKGTYIYDLAAIDASGAPHPRMVRCIWFNARYLERNKIFHSGQQVFFYGKAEPDFYGTGNLQIVQPQHEIIPESEAAEGESLEVGRMVPIYESIGNLGPRILRRLIRTGLDSVGDQFPELLPGSVRKKNKLLDRASAFRLTHFPDGKHPFDELARFRTPPQVRLIFEELFNVSAGLALKHRKAKSVPGIQFQVTDGLRRDIKKVLPFHPTSAQKKVLKEIADDMCSPRPMNRLLQGDVGSGKTIVAVQAALLALSNGCQVALMAPTEILATQHYLSIRKLLGPLPYKVELLTSGRTTRAKKELKDDLKRGEVHMLVGTHALIERDVDFAQLGLVIVDEQHRFGVLQRYRLIRKGQMPDVLVMTATPIPRTLALTLYGDLDFSVINELPPNRSPIVTKLIEERDRRQAFDFVRNKVRAGDQAYVVYPVIEESAKLDLRPALKMFQHLSANVFPEFQVGLLHGRLSSSEKDEIMDRFKKGDIRILVSTTVVEVGVDVPNATVMLIEHAERFGLSQLHQLRGRIGRGRKESSCLLLAAEPRTPEADERLRTITTTNDGFKIAEIDLKLRGPGEFFGTRQWGIPAFRIANLLRDQEILEWAKREATAFVDRPESPEEFEAYVGFLRNEWSRRYGLAGVA
ncbi:MAG TPA: ATP-dependent DNA helicase RecG [Terriglobia bacterium]|nr:ATP-dependent DNA helicase RecG [Terriglobia bacterium]